MSKKAATLKAELRKAVGGLKPIQSFNIIFLQSDGCAALDKSQLVGADRDGKRNALKFLEDATFAGTTDPIPGLTLAFQQHPQLLYLLTDGNFRDNKAVKDKIAELNKDHKVKVNTIAFVGKEDKEDSDADFLLTAVDDQDDPKHFATFDLAPPYNSRYENIRFHTRRTGVIEAGNGCRRAATITGLRCDRPDRHQR